MTRWAGGWLLRLERYALYHTILLFRIREEAERVARGFALGLVVTFFPTFGVGPVLSVLIARLGGGSMAAGLAGGILPSLAWPLLFFLNLRVGRWLRGVAKPVDYSEDLPEKLGFLALGGNFLTGAVANSLLAGTVSYALIQGFFHEVRPFALAYFRGHARDHQRRFRRAREAGPLTRGPSKVL